MSIASEFWKKWAPHIPRVECASGCQGACCGPILARQEEVKEVRRFCQERGVRPQLPLVGERVQCGFLKSDGCVIYEVRPLICRIFGVGPRVVEKLRCPFLFGAAEMSNSVYLEMINDYDRLGDLVPLEGEAAWKQWCAETITEKPII